MKKIVSLFCLCLLLSCLKKDIPTEEHVAIIDERLVGEWTLMRVATIWEISDYNERDIIYKFEDSGKLIIDDKVSNNPSSLSGVYDYTSNADLNKLYISFYSSGYTYEFENNNTRFIKALNPDSDGPTYYFNKYTK